MLRLKAGCSIKKLVPQMVVALVVVDQRFQRYGVETWITSGDDSKHRDRSKHYEGKALDFRTYHLDAVLTSGDPTEFKHAMAGQIQQLLGDQYRVAFEPTIRDVRTEHIHVEFIG